jgi:hypothetical protein
MTRLRRTLLSGLAALCTTVMVGCGGDGTAPAAGNLSNPAGLSADMNSLATPFNAPVVQSFAAVGLTASGTPAARAVAFLQAMGPARKLSADLGSQRQRALAVAALRPSFSTTILPSSAWGKTYVWDEAQQHYVEGGSGAPANGVRFMLYAVDPLTKKPASPLNAVGYADLIDASTASVAGLEVKIVGTAGTPVTYADYTITATGSSTSFTAQAVGYVSDGTHRLDFTDAIGATPTQVTLDYQLALDQSAVTARLQATLTANDPNATLAVNLRVTRGTEVVVLNGTLTFTFGQSSSSLAVNATVTVNGGLFATITGNAQSGGTASLTYTGPNGRALTQDELNALGTLLNWPGDVSGFVEGLLAPAAELLGSSAQLSV